MILLALQIRQVQTYLANEALLFISKKTSHVVSLERVRVYWLDEVALENLLVLDIEGDTLLYAKSLTVNYDITDLIGGNSIHVNEIMASNLSLNLIKHKAAEKLNLSIFLDALKSDTAKKESKPIAVDLIGLDTFQFGLEDRNKSRKAKQLDFAHLDVDVPYFSLADLTIQSDSIAGNLLQFKGLEQNTNFRISQFQTQFQLSNQSLSIDNLIFNTPSSHLSDSIQFFYSGLDDFASFVDSVSFVFHFDDTKLSREDIRLITGFDQVKEDLFVDGIFWGKVGDFNIEETKFGYGESYVIGGVSAMGLPDLKRTFILADITESHLLPSDVKPYIGTFTTNLEQMGRIDFTGSFAGFLNDFVARGDFYTDQGEVHSDLNLKIPDDPNNMSYTGNLELKDVNVGGFFKNELIQRVNLKARIDGKGIKKSNANFKMDALIYESGLKGYVYDSIRANGRFFEDFFEGSFKVDDPNCKVKGIAEIDLRENKEILDVLANISKLNADSIQLTARDIAASGKIDLEIRDFDLDFFTASLAIDSTIISIDEKELVLDSIRFNANIVDSVRIIALNAPGIHSNVEGKFKITDVAKDIPVMATGYARKLKIKEDTATLVGSGKKYYFNVDLTLSDISPYVDSLKLPIDLGSYTLIEGHFRQSKSANLQLYFESDTIEYGGNVLIEPLLEINGSEDMENETILTNVILESSRQFISGVPPTEDLLLEAIWFDDNIDITTHISQPATASDLRIESNVRLLKDSIMLKMLPSTIRLLDDDWSFNPTNRIVIKDNITQISNLEIYDSSESIAVNGVLSDSIPTSIEVYSEDLNLNKTGLFSDASIKGFLNGNFNIFRNSPEESYRFDGGFFLKDLTYEDLSVGDIAGVSNWDPSNQSIYSKVEVERENVNTIEAEGYYYPARNIDQLDFEVLFERADLAMAQPFLIDNFSDIDGYANGKLSITGNIEKPAVNGSCEIRDGEVTINYLNTHYVYNGRIRFDPQSIQFVDFELSDRKGAIATVGGSIRHKYFKEMNTDLNLVARNFEFLNTTSVDNQLYYGSAYGTGTIRVTGPLNDLDINANIRTDPNTRFFIPVSEGTSIDQESYISFIDISDTTQLQNIREDNFKLSGLTLDFDIEVTPDAYCELIFDIKTGDIIRGRGRGNLKLRMNTDGEFNMFGPLEIREGAYNFTIPNFISKEFEVIPGSVISWYGDPYNAILDLEATYTQRASFEELENLENQESEELSNRVPILVVLEINEGMLSPDIQFALRLQNEGDAAQDNSTVLEQISRDEQELTRQVISLLFLKRFSPRQSFTLSGGGGVGNSVSEFLSSQVSYLVSQIDENLEVEVDLADLNRDAFNTFQLRFAYTFLDGRLKVTRGGTFGDQNDRNDNVLNDIIGDWSVEYSLSKDGRFRAKVFSTTDQRVLVNENNLNQETGVSLRFVHSFNDLTELLTIRRDEAILRRREEEQEENGEVENPPKASTLN